MLAPFTRMGRTFAQIGYFEKSAVDAFAGPEYMPTATYELPYEGAKEMLLVDEVDDKEFMTGLFNVVYEELPVPKSKKKK